MQPLLVVLYIALTLVPLSKPFYTLCRNVPKSAICWFQDEVCLELRKPQWEAALGHHVMVLHTAGNLQMFRAQVCFIIIFIC